jgi:hypothetical protein
MRIRTDLDPGFETLVKQQGFTYAYRYLKLGTCYVYTPENVNPIWLEEDRRRF